MSTRIERIGDEEELEGREKVQEKLQTGTTCNTVMAVTGRFIEFCPESDEWFTNILWPTN